MRTAAPATSSTTDLGSPCVPGPEAVEVLQRGLRMTVRQAWGAGRALGLDEADIRELIRRAGVRAVRAIDPRRAGPLGPDGYSRRRRLEAFIAAELLEAVEACGIMHEADLFARIGRASNEVCDAPSPPLLVASGDAPTGPPKRGNYNL